MLRRRAGTNDPWVSLTDFRPPTCDSGPEIRNLTPRISELGKLHEIEAGRGPDGCARYQLLSDGGDSPPPFEEIRAAAHETARSAGGEQQVALPQEPTPTGPRPVAPVPHWMADL